MIYVSVKDHSLLQTRAFWNSWNMAAVCWSWGWDEPNYTAEHIQVDLWLIPPQILNFAASLRLGFRTLLSEVYVTWEIWRNGASGRSRKFIAFLVDLHLWFSSLNWTINTWNPYSLPSIINWAYNKQCVEVFPKFPGQPQGWKFQKIGF